MEAINVSRVCEIRHDRSSLRSDDRGPDRYRRQVPDTDARSEYVVELTACFTFGINTTLEGPRGLSREEIEGMIEADWMWISLETDVLLESSWELDSIEERELPGQLG